MFNRFINWAHRGAANDAPENTLLAFQTAVTIGADGIECDLRESKDGVPIIFHDANLSRIANRPDRINTLTYKEIRKINAGQKERIPTLSEVIENTPPNFLLNLEMKAIRPHLLLDEVYRHNAQGRVLISAFNARALFAIRSLDSSIKIGYLVEKKMGADVFEKATKMDAFSLHLSKKLITKRRVEQIHRRGFLVYSYTVDEVDRMKQFIGIGVDGLFTNCPDRLVNLLAERPLRKVG